MRRYSPWLSRGIPDLAYGTSAHIPDLAYGTSAAIQSPGGGSLDARLPVLNTNRPGGVAADSSRTFLLGPLYTRSPISALMELGTEWRPRVRSHAIVSADFQRWESSRHIVPSSSSQYFGMSERNCTGCFKNGDWIMICCSKVSCK